MGKRRINMTDLIIGAPLQWDVYDSTGHLLLGKGHMLVHARQLETLVERGLFIDALGESGDGKRAACAQAAETPSALRMINQVNRRLEALLVNLPNETGAEAKLLEAANVLIRAAASEPDIALASILLNQQCGIYPVRHSIDTAIVALLVASSLHKPADEITLVTAAALTMNVGMLRLQETLQHSAAPLSAEESKTIQEHPQESARMLQHAGVAQQDWLSWVLHHHENEDGSGYPHGKHGADIPANAKLISLADRYCARVSTRNYRKSLLPNAALRDILLADKNNIDPAVASAFIRELGIYPTGTLVRLQNGEIGVVTGRGPSTTTPKVHALIGPRGAPLAQAFRRDTEKQLYAIRDVLTEEQASMRFTMQQLWGPAAAL
ncbi:HD domain-containing phosphohydrolase [Janthinobacterium sp. 17J80-10]|uniref:HD-GYP domain-containing protein n=1 Tax=Janthinobacterium sp. 17J80-10 TaxID=2497863 RepID=UPI001005398B|nr:HD domain-containing phosphohydrolase [Janthinobacterium sp. 17J80-10]QAU34285.1 HD domain-containing protein [Janthinobacterium sp. 17J80-10]